MSTQNRYLLYALRGTDTTRFLETMNVGDIGVVQRGERVPFACECA